MKKVRVFMNHLIFSEKVQWRISANSAMNISKIPQLSDLWNYLICWNFTHWTPSSITKRISKIIVKFPRNLAITIWYWLIHCSTWILSIYPDMNESTCGNNILISLLGKLAGVWKFYGNFKVSIQKGILWKSLSCLTLFENLYHPASITQYTQLVLKSVYNTKLFGLYTNSYTPI
jgi:hypothetical protein